MNKLSEDQLDDLKITYKVLKKIDKYSFIEGHPLLLPIVWVYRAVLALLDKTLVFKIKDIAGKSFVSKKNITKREEVIRRWGLD